MTEPSNTPGMDKVIAQIQKLLNLAANNPNENEAASAAAKAQELLVKYNLDSAVLETAKGVDGKREQAKVEGGFYKHQRELWYAVAALNFCLYWTQRYKERGIRKRYNQGLPPIETWITKQRHALVGKVVNTQMTIAMAQYLETAIERVVDERLKEQEIAKMSNWAMSFRKGCISRVVEKLQDRRREYVAKEEEARRAAERANSGASTSTALSISAYVNAEYDANMDFIYGEGWSAKQAKERAERAAKRAADEAAYTAWAQANPEEAAKREAAAKKARGRASYGRTERDNTDYSAYYSGYDAADKISLDQQVKASGNEARIGRV